jgi:hypothetical protein
MRELNGLNPLLAICCSRTEVRVILRDGHTAISLGRPRYVHTFSCKMALTSRKPCDNTTFRKILRVEFPSPPFR